MTIVARVAVLAALLSSASARAQVTDAFFGTKANFLKSSFCTRIATCTSAGSLRLVGSTGTINMTEDYYTVKPKQKQSYGPPAYTVFFTRRIDGVVQRAGLRYYPAQDHVEDGAFAIEFFSFASGVPLHAIEGYSLMGECGTNIRGKTQYFSLSGGSHLPIGNASEQTLLLLENYYGKTMFAQQATSTRVFRNPC